jgi:hypothetical protein
MQATTFAFAAALVAAAPACAQTSQPAAVTAPVASPAAGSGSPGTAGGAGPVAAPPATASAPSGSTASQGSSTASSDASTGGGATGTAAAAPGPAAGADAGAPAQFRSCALDSECVAVDRVGCCHNGWKEAVATAQKDAYAKSFTCPEANPICPMYMVRDGRVPLCDNATHLCTMTRPDDVACGGFIRNKHSCPPGYRCQLSKHPDVAGKCVQQP